MSANSAALLLTTAAIVTLVLTEIARSIVHRRRVRTGQLGRSQDVAMIGVAIAGPLLIASVIAVVISARSVDAARGRDRGHAEPLKPTMESVR